MSSNSTAISEKRISAPVRAIAGRRLAVRAAGRLAYRNGDPETYKRSYKTKDTSKAWADLIDLCKVLNTTLPERKGDRSDSGRGYWVRTSDYSLCEDPTGNDAPRLCLKGLADQRRAYLLDFT